MTPQEQQQFETWATAQGEDVDRIYGLDGNDYCVDLRLAWRAWQAATAAERERCAKVADSMNTFGLPPDVGAAIRTG